MEQTKQTQTAQGTTANQILQNAWTTQIDSQTAQQLTGLVQVRQARANQLQRETVSLTKAYGAADPGVLAVQASLQNEQTFASRLGVAHDTTSTAAPTAPANGWVLYGHVRNADLTPAAHLTVFLADEGRAWLKKYAYAFTDQTGYFTLSYTPPAAGRKARESEEDAKALSAYVEVSNASCKLMYVDAAAMSIATGVAVYRDIVLSGEGPLGTPPCEPGAPSSVPRLRK